MTLLLLVEVVTIHVRAVHVVPLLTIVIVKAPFVAVLRLLHGHHRLHHMELQEDLLLLIIEGLQLVVRLLEAVVEALAVLMIVAAVLLLVAAIHQVAVVALVPVAAIQVVDLHARVVAVADLAEAEEDNKHYILTL